MGVKRDVPVPPEWTIMHRSYERGNRTTMSDQPLASAKLEFGDAYEAIEHFYRHGWTDGLPVVPPTVDAVRRFLDYAGRSPSDIVGSEPVKGRVVTAEKVAINSVMAGCLPEYFPVVLAAVEAMCEPRFNLHAVTASTMGAAVLTVVSGPIAAELEINSGVSVFGPGHRANATIGRAIRLVISNVTGALPGLLDKATLGHGGKFSWCVAEAEDMSPWEPLHVDRGLARPQSAVTVFAGLSPIQVGSHAGDPESILAAFRDGLLASGAGQKELVVVVCPEHLGILHAAGWSKGRLRERLFELGQRPLAHWGIAGAQTAGPAVEDTEAMLGAVDSAGGVTVLVTGGQAGGFSAIVPLWGGGSNSVPVTREVTAPGARGRTQADGIR